MSYADGIGEAFGCLITIAITSVIIAIGFTAYFMYDNLSSKSFETKTIIKPDYRLEANGKKIDTIYIYKIK